MNTSLAHSLARSLAHATTAALLAACADVTPLAPKRQLASSAPLAARAAAEGNAAIATLRRATARYHNLNAALADGFVFLHGCETRPEEGPAGVVYVHMGRLTDGVIDPATPDALLYEPSHNGSPKLVGVELAVPYALWTGAEPPEFLGATFQREEEFGVFGLHVWVWRNNPNGLFAESNPRITCGVQ
jgi:hypothetical protein